MQKLFILSVLIISFLSGATEQCIITMGYKTNNKEPYILKDNSGLYKDLYEKVAKMIECELKIKREPKKRILSKIKKGEIDFYPGFTFKKERAKFVHYIKNGLPKGFAVITRDNISELTNINQVKELNLKVLLELGGANLLENMNLNFVKVRELNLKKAVNMIQNKRADFFIYNRSQILYFFKKYKPRGLKVHTDLYKKEESLLLGFSKKSKYIIEIPNPKFDKNKEWSFLNYPMILDEVSVSYKFQNALNILKENGTTDKLYKKYFK